MSELSCFYYRYLFGGFCGSVLLTVRWLTRVEPESAFPHVLVAVKEACLLLRDCHTGREKIASPSHYTDVYHFSSYLVCNISLIFSWKHINQCSCWTNSSIRIPRPSRRTSTLEIPVALKSTPGLRWILINLGSSMWSVRSVMTWFAVLYTPFTGLSIGSCQINCIGIKIVALVLEYPLKISRHLIINFGTTTTASWTVRSVDAIAELDGSTVR